MRWHHIFQKHILERGREYYERGLVKVLDYSSDSATAQVKGTQNYNVHIDFEGNQVAVASCNCPHARGGNYCKHLAAVFFSLENMKEFEGSNDEDIDALVDETDEDFTRKFLKEILKKNPKILSLFKGKRGHELTEHDISIYKNEIDEIFYRHEDSYGFIHYNNASDFHMDLSYFIEDEIKNNLLENFDYETAFELTKNIFIKLANQELDDSGGTTTMLADDCINIWNEMVEKSNSKFKREMFHWFKNQLDGSLIDYMEEHIEHILFSNFRETEYLEEKVEFTKEKFDYFNASNDDWWGNFQAQEWGLKYLGTLKLLENQEEIRRFCEENLEFPRIRELYIDYWLKHKDYEKVISLIEDDKYSEGVSRHYQIKLKELYLKIGNEEKYRALLWELITDRNFLDFEVYQEYKRLYSKGEWAKKRMDILEKFSNVSGIDDLYVEEEQYDLLLEYVLNQHGLSYLQKHEEILIELYPKKVFDRYEVEIMNESQHTGTRAKYRSIVAMIRSLRKLSNSETRVFEIVKKLQTNYDNRPAMMDELSRL